MMVFIIFYSDSHDVPWNKQLLIDDVPESQQMIIIFIQPRNKNQENPNW